MTNTNKQEQHRHKQQRNQVPGPGGSSKAVADTKRALVAASSTGISNQCFLLGLWLSSLSLSLKKQHVVPFFKGLVSDRIMVLPWCIAGLTGFLHGAACPQLTNSVSGCVSWGVTNLYLFISCHFDVTPFIFTCPPLKWSVGPSVMKHRYSRVTNAPMTFPSAVSVWLHFR